MLITNSIQHKAVKNILKEREAQIKKFGDQDHKPEMWLTILSEEVGELSKEVLESIFKNKHYIWNDNYEKELIQVAAVSLAMLENLYTLRS